KFSSSINSTGTGDSEKTIKKFSYTLLPTSSGSAKIDPIVISFISLPDSSRGQLQTEPVIINVADPIIVEESESFALWFLAMGGFLLIGGVAAAFFLIKGGGIEEEVFTPVQIALQELTKVKEDSGTDFKKFQAGVYRLLTKFSKENYQIETAGKSEAEIRAQYELDWVEWRAQDGAPYLDGNNNGQYDPDPFSNDVPGIEGANQTVWFVANDLNAALTTNLYGTQPIGIEYQATYWA
ncbi:MAG: hypothetical protein IH795_10630, partial [Bacteroidetes bacterium]|nr:hypothetical protein [Bacteroidota bacterium]